jgi:hypothetical protein
VESGGFREFGVFLGFRRFVGQPAGQVSWSGIWTTGANLHDLLGGVAERLGLSVSRGLAQLLGGDITVASETCGRSALALDVPAAYSPEIHPA